MEISGQEEIHPEGWVVHDVVQKQKEIRRLRRDSKEVEEKSKKLEHTEEKLEPEHAYELNRTLIFMERQSKDEVQEARRQLISAFKDKETSSRCNICVKRMGELDPQPILKALKRKEVESAEERACVMCSEW